MPQQELDQLRIARQLNKWTATGVIVAALALVAATVGYLRRGDCLGFIGAKSKTAVASVRFRNIGKTPAYK